MSVTATSKDEPSPPVSRWRLWIDGCGGYLLMTGNQWSVGGVDENRPPDICVRADWPRRAGKIDRDSADYFWQASSDPDSRQLITPGQPVPIGGSAIMTLACPSPLSNSAVLSLAPPHRFDGHVDGIVLADQTILVGPEADCHIRTRDFPDRAVLVNRGGKWLGKLEGRRDFAEVTPGMRITLQSLAMTLEEA